MLPDVNAYTSEVYALVRATDCHLRKLISGSVDPSTPVAFVTDSLSTAQMLHAAQEGRTFSCRRQWEIELLQNLARITQLLSTDNTPKIIFVPSHEGVIVNHAIDELVTAIKTTEKRNVSCENTMPLARTEFRASLRAAASRAELAFFSDLAFPPGTDEDTRSRSYDLSARTYCTSAEGIVALGISRQKAREVLKKVRPQAEGVFLAALLGVLYRRFVYDGAKSGRSAFLARSCAKCLGTGVATVDSLGHALNCVDCDFGLDDAGGVANFFNCYADEQQEQTDRFYDLRTRITGKRGWKGSFSDPRRHVYMSVDDLMHDHEVKVLDQDDPDLCGCGALECDHCNDPDLGFSESQQGDLTDEEDFVFGFFNRLQGDVLPRGEDLLARGVGSMEKMTARVLSRLDEPVLGLGALLNSDSASL